MKKWQDSWTLDGWCSWITLHVLFLPINLLIAIAGLSHWLYRIGSEELLKEE